MILLNLPLSYCIIERCYNQLYSPNFIFALFIKNSRICKGFEMKSSPGNRLMTPTNVCGFSSRINVGISAPKTRCFHILKRVLLERVLASHFFKPAEFHQTPIFLKVMKFFLLNIHANLSLNKSFPTFSHTSNVASAA